MPLGPEQGDKEVVPFSPHPCLKNSPSRCREVKNRLGFELIIFQEEFSEVADKQLRTSRPPVAQWLPGPSKSAFHFALRNRILFILQLGLSKLEGLNNGSKILRRERILGIKNLLQRRRLFTRGAHPNSASTAMRPHH